jgi:hypothetical protein
MNRRYAPYVAKRKTEAKYLGTKKKKGGKGSDFGEEV